MVLTAPGYLMTVICLVIDGFSGSLLESGLIRTGWTIARPLSSDVVRFLFETVFFNPGSKNLPIIG